MPNSLPPKNIICSMLEEAYGPTAPKQFGALAQKNNFDIDDIIQDACCIYLEKKASYDPNYGPIANFLWKPLKYRIKQKSIGPLKFAISLDQLRESEHPLQEELNDVLNLDEATEKEILKSWPEMQDCIDFVKKISGMSSIEAAKMLNLTKRAFNYKLKKFCEIAKNIRKKNGK